MKILFFTTVYEWTSAFLMYVPIERRNAMQSFLSPPSPFTHSNLISKLDMSLPHITGL